MTDKLFDAVLDLLWRQWRSIGGAAAATGEPVLKQVDPEALCLASLCFRDHEPRLWTVMTDWIRFGGSLLSVQRLKNLATHFPAVVGKGVQALALVALEEGKDARWRSLIPGGRGAVKVRPSTKQRSRGPALTAPPALMLRLRAAFGVSVKADLLAFLLGQQFRVTVATAATSLGYSKPPVFRSLQDLVAVRLVHAAELQAAAEYSLNMADWFTVLGGAHAVAYWGFWREVLAYACAAFMLERERNYLRSSDYARATALRELASEHEAGLVRSGIIEGALSDSASWADWREFHSALAKRMASLA